eukprot:296645-Pyramimonas_sp.AAC.2
MPILVVGPLSPSTAPPISLGRKVLQIATSLQTKPAVYWSTAGTSTTRPLKQSAAKTTELSGSRSSLWVMSSKRNFGGEFCLMILLGASPKAPFASDANALTGRGMPPTPSFAQRALMAPTSWRHAQ